MMLNPADNPLLCRHSLVRRDACACRVCADRANPANKFAENKRDAEHLLSFILSCLDNHDHANMDKPHWGDVESMGHMRARLKELAAQFITSDNRTETEIDERIEIGLSVDDEEVMHELISMTF